MICPFCKDLNTKVVDKRDSEDESLTRRRRECLKCNKRFTTYEKIETAFIKVIKKDGTLQDFDKDKIIKGILKASEKRFSEEKAFEIADQLEAKILERKSSKISASDIGRLILTRLKKVDEVAYIRFASVFLGFENIDDFKSVIKKFE